MNKQVIAAVVLTAAIIIPIQYIILRNSTPSPSIASISVCDRLQAEAGFSQHEQMVVPLSIAEQHVKEFGKWRRAIADAGITKPGGIEPGVNETTCAYSFEWETMKLAFGVDAQGNPSQDFVRAYMGIRTDEDNEKRMCLYFVPLVEDEEQSTPVEYNDATFECLTNNETEHYVLNLTTPCPKTCGRKKGALRNAFLQGWDE